MEDAEIEWNFRTLVDGWIFYGLPVLLVAVAVTVLIRVRWPADGMLTASPYGQPVAGARIRFVHSAWSRRV